MAIDIDDVKLRTDLGAIGESGSDLLRQERELLTTDIKNTTIGEQQVDLGDIYRKSIREGTFTNLMSTPLERARAQANLDLGIEPGVENVSFDPTKVDLEGDLAQLSAKYGIGQNVIVGGRQAQSTTPVVSETGAATDRELSSIQERQALPTQGTASTANSYWDASRGVEIYARPGEYFELYQGGGVRIKKGELPEGSGAPASSLFTQPTNNLGQATPGFKEEQLGLTPAEGKEIKRTGQTIKNPQTGVDVHAKEGTILIEYTDGTVEERAIGSINQPGQTTSIGEFGPTAGELGITRDTEIKGGEGTEVTREPFSAKEELQAALAQSPEAGNELIKSQGLIGAEETTYLGTSYKGKQAGQGNAFYRAPDGTVLERSAALKPLAKELAAEAAGQAVGTGQIRFTDGLIGAAASFGIDLSGDETTNAIIEGLRNRPVVNVEQMYSQIQERMGVSTIKQNIDLIQQKQEAERIKFNDQVEDINSNPWSSEGLRTEKIRRASEKYEANKAGLAAELALYTALQDSARQEAQFVVGNAVNQANADRAFDMSLAQMAFDRIDQKFNAQVQIANLSMQQQQMKQSADQFLQQMALQREEIETSKQQFSQQFEQGQYEFEENLALQRQQEARLASGGGSAGERAVSLLGAISGQIDSILAGDRNVGAGGAFTTIAAYRDARSTALQQGVSPDDFDVVYGNQLSPYDRLTYGIGSTTNISQIENVQAGGDSGSLVDKYRP